MDSYWQLPAQARYRFGDHEDGVVAVRTKRALGLYREEIEQAHISTVKGIVAIPTRPSWRAEQQQVLLYTFGTFSSMYHTIELLATSLAKPYLEFGVLPVIRPILNREGQREVDAVRQLGRRFSRFGMLLVEKY